MDNFISEKSKDLFSRLQINTDFLEVCPSTSEENTSFWNAKQLVDSLKAVNDTAEQAVKLMQDFNGLFTVGDEQKEYVLCCIQEHWLLGLQKRNIKEKIPIIIIYNIV